MTIDDMGQLLIDYGSTGGTFSRISEVRQTYRLVNGELELISEEPLPVAP